MGIKKKTSKNDSVETSITGQTNTTSVKKSVKKASTSRSSALTNESECVKKTVKRVKKSVAKSAGRTKKSSSEASPFSAKERRLKWEQVKSILRNKDVAELVDNIGKLYCSSNDLAELIRSVFLKDALGTEALLEEFRKSIAQPFGLDRKSFVDPPRIGGLKRKIRDYLKGTGDVRGAVDLSLTLQETALAYTMEWGDINDQFYDPLISAADDLTKLATKSCEREAIFKEFKERLLKLGDEASGLGWGYGSAICGMVEDIFFENGIGLERERDGENSVHTHWTTYELDEEDLEQIGHSEEKEWFHF